jgi:hypothetical protein
MSLIPQNRHLLVELIEAEAEPPPAILVPDDYVVSPTEQYQLVRVLATAPDSHHKVGQCAVVEGHMLKSVTVRGQIHQLVLENYVLALVEDAAL